MFTTVNPEGDMDVLNFMAIHPAVLKVYFT